MRDRWEKDVCMFWKRKDEQPTSQRAANTQRQWPGTPTGIGKFTTVIVPRSAVLRAADPKRAYDLVQAVINFVNTMMGAGVYSRDEIPAKTMQAYHADYYLAQVQNGGHSQFIHNCQKDLPYILSDVRAGLTGMKADKHLLIFERMAAWIAHHPDEASKLTGFNGGRDPLLDKLDGEFYGADGESPMIQQSALWIASWPELRPVDDADYKEAMRQSVLMNPLREARLVWRSVDSLRAQMTQWFHVAVGLACSNANPQEFKLEIRGGWIMEIERSNETAWFVVTNAQQPRYCVVTENHAAAYEFINMKTAGRKLSYVRPEAIRGVIELAKEIDAPVILDLLLRRAETETKGAMVSPMAITLKTPKGDGPLLHCLVAAGGQTFHAVSASTRGMLFRATDNQQLAIVRKSDIQEHAVRAEAGAIRLS
jgi:hypothetical protein